MVYGLTSQGFIPKDLETIKGELEDTWREKFGQNVEVEPESPDGQIIGLMADRESDIQDLVEQVYSAAYLDGASGASLDDLVGLADMTRLPATKSVAALTLGGTVGTLIPAGSIVEESVTGRLWTTLADATIAPGGTVEVNASPADTGPIAALAGTIDTINTPVSGWNSVTNAADAELGENIETDASLRTRYRDQFKGDGSSDEAIVAALLRLDGVTEAVVVSNRTAFEVNGQPAKSLHAVVEGGTDSDILSRLWDKAPAGIEFFGSITGVVNDDNGDAQTIKFSRFAVVPVYIDVVYEVEPNPDDDIEDQVLAEILEKATTLKGGNDVIPFQFKQAIETTKILDLEFRVGLSAITTQEEVLAIERTQKADIDSSRIVFTRTN